MPCLLMLYPIFNEIILCGIVLIKLKEIMQLNINNTCIFVITCTGIYLLAVSWKSRRQGGKGFGEVSC